MISCLIYVLSFVSVILIFALKIQLEAQRRDISQRFFVLFLFGWFFCGRGGRSCLTYCTDEDCGFFYTQLHLKNHIWNITNLCCDIFINFTLLVPVYPKQLNSGQERLEMMVINIFHGQSMYWIWWDVNNFNWKIEMDR